MNDSRSGDVRRNRRFVASGNSSGNSHELRRGGSAHATDQVQSDRCEGKRAIGHARSRDGTNVRVAPDAQAVLDCASVSISIRDPVSKARAIELVDAALRDWGLALTANSQNIFVTKAPGPALKTCTGS